MTHELEGKLVAVLAITLACFASAAALGSLVTGEWVYDVNETGAINAMLVAGLFGMWYLREPARRKR